MHVGSIAGVNGALQSYAPHSRQTGAKQAVPDSAATRSRDRVERCYDEVVKAAREGYVEINGSRFVLSEEMASDMEQAREQIRARSEGIEARLDAERKAREERQQNETAMKKGKSMGRAMEIARRISEGARVPAEDEHFLMAFSQEMYQAAKMTADMAADTAAEQKEFDSVFEPGELAVMDAQRILDEMKKDMGEQLIV